MTGTRRPPTPDLEIRPLARHDELEQCIDLQRATWGDDFRELVPPAMLTIVQKIGGLALGAFDALDQLAGFVFGITGMIDGAPLHWSHMLAVDGRRRDQGIGRLLKHAQRERLLAAGVTRARWTFDPLVARNAFVNLECLGTDVLEYVEDMYGDNPMSETDSVIGSDRFVVEWKLDAPVRPSITFDATAPLLDLEHSEVATLPADRTVRVAIPRDIQALKRSDPMRARAWRTATSLTFRYYLTRGYSVVGFSRGHPGAHGTYVLTRDSGRP